MYTSSVALNLRLFLYEFLSLMPDQLARRKASQCCSARVQCSTNPIRYTLCKGELFH